MNLYNTLTRSVEEFKPQNKKVSFYSCGPTVYDYPTIGNWTTYIRWDILARLLAQDYELDWYMNITDVGHLVSDADEGEDKLEKAAAREDKTAWQVADFYTQDFIKGMKELNISIPQEHLVKATDNISEQIELIQKLDSKSYTYIIDDGVYFDSSKLSDYGKLAKLNIEGLRAGARIKIGQKKNPTDFALWKFTPKGKKRDMEWDSPWGKGFPGWHLECSAMALKFLGETIDIHSGGIDNIPVHHTNEIAQSEAATEKKPFVRYWLHSNFLQVDGTKIAKSLGNGYTINDIVEKGYTPMHFRLFVLQSHYQTESNFTWEGLDGARGRLFDLQAAADLRFQPQKQSVDHNNSYAAWKAAIREALNANLNTPLALAELNDFMDIIKSTGVSEDSLAGFIDFLELIDQLFGLNILDSEDIADSQKDQILARQKARVDKNWKLSDSIRDKLLSEGIGLNDSQAATTWYRLN